MSHKEDRWYSDAVRLLSQDVSKKVQILAETSCMELESRKLIAILEWTKIQKIYSLTENQIKYIDATIEYFKYTGHALWGRDVLTDLGLRKGIEDEHISATKR